MRFHRRWFGSVAPLALLAMATALRAQPATAPASQPADAGPIRVETFVRQNPPLRGVIARIDLTDPRVEITAATGGPDPDGDGPWETVLTRTSDIARANDFDLAVNGTFFAHRMEDPRVRSYAQNAPARSSQPVMIDGTFVSAVRTGPAVMVGPGNTVTIGSVGPSAPPGVRTILGGSAQIVNRGQNAVKRDAPRAPRTAIGVTEDGKTLILLVVDGRRPDFSVGLTTKELADEMIRLGCHHALNFDGGGSSTIVRKFGRNTFRILNTPSDGSQLAPLPLSIERPVANVLGIRIRPAPTTVPTATTQPAAK